jgi:hypothetical protein
LNTCGTWGTNDVSWPQVASAAEGLSHGKIVRAREQAAKNVLLEDRTQVASRDLTAAITDRRIER